MNSLQCTLFVTTTMNWENTCTVCHYYEFTRVYSVCGHYYELGEHMYCLWPLQQIGSTHVLFVATTMNSLQCTLFVATTTNWECTCTVCGHYYKLGVHVYCLWSLLQIGSTCVLFVATTMNSLQCTLFVATTTNWEYMCTVCGHY